MTERHYRRSVAEIDLRRIKDNFKRFTSIAPNESFICPMVKADAYGHGASHVAKALRSQGAKHLGVALVEEGEQLRRAGDQESILVFGPVDSEGAESAVRERLTIVVSEWDHLEALDQARLKLGEAKVGVHVEFNTGMNRLGFDVSEAQKVRAYFQNSRGFRLEGLCTHLLRGDDAGAESGESKLQLAAFEVALGSFKDMPNVFKHALNSSAAINVHARKSNSSLGLRPGIGLYGYGGKNDEGFDLNLKPALSLKTHIASLHKVGPDSRVSYGPSWKAKRDSLIGVVPFGYADGYKRSLSNKAQILCHGQRAPVAGTVCMDYFMIDLTDVKPAAGQEIEIGNEVVLIGEQGNESITAFDLADWAGTISYEILTGISARVPRIYLG
ncbi:MAG: alanine racemase [Bdellovibrionota bacterium]